jgi:hypothetical protein
MSPLPEGRSRLGPAGDGRALRRPAQPAFFSRGRRDSGTQVCAECPIQANQADFPDPCVGHTGDMPFSAGTCEDCGRPTRERIETATGRLICRSCLDTLQASSAAVMAGGGAGEAIAIRGWMRRARAWRLGKNQGRPRASVERPGGEPTPPDA